MDVLQVSRFVAGLIFVAVRAFGWLAWYRNAADSRAGFNRVTPAAALKAISSSTRPSLLSRLSSDVALRLRGGHPPVA
jgi:hypothetical protein